MTPEAAEIVGYVRGRADERVAAIKGADKRGLEVVLMPERSLLFVGRCRLCGEAARGTFCHSCSWAYGEALA